MFAFSFGAKLAITDTPAGANIVIRISKDARFVAEGDGGLVMDIQGDRFFDLNRTGASIWSRAAEGHTESEIVALTAADAGCEAVLTSAPIREFLLALARLQLIDFDPEAQVTTEVGL